MRFLFTIWNFPGCLHPALAVAETLKERGHAVAFYTGVAYRPEIEGHAFEFFPFQPKLEQIVKERVYSTDSVGANWNRPWKVPSLLSDLFVSSMPLQIDDLTAILDKWHPDVIVCDPSMFAPYLVLYERTGIPVALLSYPLGCQVPGPEIPPVGLGLPLPGGAVSRARNALVGKLLDVALSGFRNGVNQVRRAHGLEAVHGPVVNVIPRLPLYLILSCREIDYPRKVPANARYIGACAYYPDQPVPASIRDLAPDATCVYVNEGTIHSDSPYIMRAACAGLGDLPVKLILTSGPHRDPRQLGVGPWPPNTIVEQWVNHDVLMPRIRAMVCTGGSGTLLAALRHGVPSVIVATEWDHTENAQRLVRIGAAVRLSPRQCTPSRLRKAVMTLLDDPSYRENAMRISKAMKNYGGATEAADLLEAL